MNDSYSVRLLTIGRQVFVLVLLLCFGAAATGAADEQYKGIVRTESSNAAPLETPFWADAEHLRLDVTLPMEMTVVWSFGNEPSMRLIRHDERVYVEWGERQLENARQMVQSARLEKPGAAMETLQFAATGARAMFEGWDALEVSSLPEQPGSRLWLTHDTSYGLAEFFAHYAQALNETTQFPMVGGDNPPLGLGKNIALPLDRLASAVGLDGHIVRIVDPGQGGDAAVSTTITLHSLEAGPFPGNVFSVPDGYLKKLQLTTGPN